MADGAVGMIPPLFDPARAVQLGAPSAATTAAWVEQQLRFHEDNYTTLRPVTAAFTTFNVACRRPPPTGIGFVRGVGSADLICIGLQEVDMSASAMLREETEAGPLWTAAAEQSVNAASGDYRLLCARQLVGLMLIVFVKIELIPFIRATKIVTLATGALGAVGNKGAVGLRMQLHASTFCVINCHLAAHQEAVAKRNQDIAAILSQMDMTPDDPATAAASAPPSTSGSPAPGSLALGTVLLPRDHDVCVVIGDLNYRVDMTYEQALALCRRRDVKGLLREDQLVKEMGQRHTPWHGFADLTPPFLPTYRFDQGTSTYDTSEKRRVPSFTDRVMWRARDARHRAAVQVVSLAAPMEVDCSDHKPVIACMELPAKAVDPPLLDAVRRSLQQTVQRLGLDVAAAPRISLHAVAGDSDAEGSPPAGAVAPVGSLNGPATPQSATLSPGAPATSAASLDFGHQSYLDCGRSHRILVRNDGDCAALVRVSRQAVDDATDGTWLRVSPAVGCVLPGGTLEVTIEARIDWAALRWAVNELPFRGGRPISVHSLLLVAADGGPTKALECRCALTPTCMAVPIDGLMRLQTIPAARAFQMPKDAAPPLPHYPQVPKELWVLCDYFANGGISPAAVTLAEVGRHVIPPFARKPAEAPELFEADGDPVQVAAVLRHLNAACTPLRDATTESATAPTTPEAAAHSATRLAALLRATGGADLPAPRPDVEPVTFDPHAVAAALLVLLRDLPLAAVPPSHYRAALAAGRTSPHAPPSAAAVGAACMAVVLQLPAAHFNVFMYLVSFWRMLLRPSHVASSGLTVARMARVFANAVFPIAQLSRPQVINAAPERTGHGSAAGGSAAAAAAAAAHAASGGGLKATIGGPGGGVGGAGVAAAVAAGHSPGVSVTDSHGTMALRSEFDSELGAAVRFLEAFLLGRPELSAVVN